MITNYKLPHFFANIDNVSLDKRTSDCSRHDIKQICRFFCLGKLQHYEKEKGITLSHFNFFVFASTAQGQYALKFYLPDAAQSIATEYALNRILLNHHFLTPMMYAGLHGQPFFPSNNRLVACYSYIDGLQAWQVIKQRNIFSKINAAMLSLKNILSTTHERLTFRKTESLVTTINALARNSRCITPYDQKELIDTFLLDACRTYQHHQQLFTRQRLHSNTHLDNFLIYKKTIYTLDLSHVQEDYVLVDLQEVVISCLFLDISTTRIKTIIKDYFTKHRIGAQYSLVLDALVKIMLIKKYLNNIQYKRSLRLSENEKSIIAALIKMNALTKFML